MTGSVSCTLPYREKWSIINPPQARKAHLFTEILKGREDMIGDRNYNYLHSAPCTVVTVSTALHHPSSPTPHGVRQRRLSGSGGIAERGEIRG